MDRKLRYGQVGGGEGSFIGHVHRVAIAMNSQAELVSGVFSHDYQETLKTAGILGISEDRVYRDFKEMAYVEGKREERIDFVVISLPNHLHFEAAKAFLENGINVVCEKPMTLTVEEAEELLNIVEESSLEMMVLYTYAGYPMVREMRKRILDGKIGDVRFVIAEYPQDWMLGRPEIKGHKQAVWRSNPEYGGVSCCVADIGTHVEYIVRYVTNMDVKRVLAKMEVVEKGRLLDDNAYIIVEYESGASGNYWVSQVAAGSINDLRVRVFGSYGSIEWRHSNPEFLRLSLNGEHDAILHKGRDYLYVPSARVSRLPAGHPEGFLEAFSNLYGYFCDTLIEKKKGIIREDRDFPTVIDGYKGIKFVHACVRSSAAGSVWVNL